MTNHIARLDRIEAILAPRLRLAGPVFIQPRGCLDPEAFAGSCREIAGETACIVILPENGREASASTAALTLHFQPSQD